MDTLTLARDFASLLLDSAAKGTALLLLGAVAVWLCRRSSAALRHSIWCMTMGGLLLLPIASWALPAWQIPVLPPASIQALAPVAEVVRLPASSPVVETATLPAVEFAPQFAAEQPEMQSEQRPIEPVVITSTVIEPSPIPAPVDREAAAALTTSEWMALLVTGGWLLGVTLFGVLLLVGLLRTVKLRRTSLMVTDGVWPGLMTELRQRLGLSRSVELREHALSVVPLTWGIWRPVVLLPSLARTWKEPMQRAVLLHELAHVQRCDVACQVLGRLTCVLYWFHPLTWCALRQLRQEREQACDDAVVQSGEKASDYAEQLLEVARLCCAPSGLSLGVAMAEGSSLETRVKSLFDTSRGHGPVSRRLGFASLLIGGTILAGLAPIEPTASQAETAWNRTSPLNETAEADPTSASNGTKPRATKVEYPFSLDLCRMPFSDPTCLQQLEELKPAYGKASRGIQLGLAVNTLSRSFAAGERLPLMLVYRNVGQEELTFHISQDHWNDPPTVIDQNGKHIHVTFVMHFMFVAPLKITLKPGEAWCEMTPGLYLGEPMPSIKPVAGRYRLTHLQGISDWQYEQRLETDGSAAGQIVNSPKWFEQLDTGTIEFEIGPSKNGALEARVLASLPADDSGVARTPTQEPAVPQKESTPAGKNDKAPKVDDVNPHEKLIVLPDGNGDSKTIITGGVEITLELDKIVWWGEAIDGLEPGLWLTETEDPRNLRVPMDSLVMYRVLVRNTTDKAIEFLVRLLPFDGNDVPYLIPSSQLDAKGKIVAPQPAKEYQAQTQGAADRINRAYVITLAAGESALVPGEYGLYVGKTDDIDIPSISDFVPGTHWIVQPLLLHRLFDKERAELNRLLGEFKVTKIDRDGKTREEPVVRVVAPDDSKGKFAYAKYHLEVGTLDASADRNARAAIWGKVEQGMQCGIRILNPQPSYKIGDTLEAEVLWRNTSEAVISTSRPRQLDLYSSIEDAEGKHVEIDFGARYDLLPGGHDFQPGEVRSLGVTKVRLVAQGTPGPKDNKEPGHITLEPGKYKLSASGSVGNINPNSGKYEFTVAAPEATQPPVAPPNTITGQIVDDKRVGIAGADVALVAFEIVQGQLERQGHVIATTIADPLGNYSLKLPTEEADRKKFGAVWAKAKGHVAARSNWSTVIASLPERTAVLTLAATEGTHVRVLDSAGKPLPGAKLVPVSVGVPKGVGYPLPKEWEEQSSGTSDVEGRANLPHVDAEAMKGLDIVPPGEMGIMRYGQNHFLNIRPRKEGDQHFEFQLPETGSVTGKLVVSPGSTLPKGLTITLESYIKPHSLSQAVVTVSVDDEGKFHVDKMAAGWLFVPAFLPADQSLRADVAGQIEVKANEELALRIPVAPGVKIHGQVRKSDTQEGVPKYSVTVIYGQAVSNLSPGFAWLKYEVETDANGRFECLVPPGPVNVNTSSYVDGYSSAFSWLPKEKRGHWGGMRFVVPAEESFDLGHIELTRNVDIQGQVVNLKNESLINWSVYGYPNIPGFTQSGTMNSMPGVHTDNEGNFSGSYRQTYPPAFWKVSQRIWKTKYEFDDHKYAARVISRKPLVLQVDTTKELSGDGDESIPIDPEAPVSPVTPAAPTKSEVTQPAPNIPQTRPNLRGAPTPAEPRPEVDMKRELLQRLVRGGKISSDSLNAMITLVSSEGAYDWEFISVILGKFDESCEPESKLSKRNLLAVLTKILEIHGSSRWQEPGPDSIPQAVIPDTESLSRLTSEILEHLIAQGARADRSDIDAFVMALREAHHADGKEFLRLVLQNPEVNVPANKKPGLWADNMGGTWRDARFHAAVALAELGEPEGVERLIEFARPNDFGLDESLFSVAHTRDASGSRRASSLFALIDLFGLEPDAGFAQMEAWWKVNQGQFHPKKVALGHAIPPRTPEQPQQ